MTTEGDDEGALAVVADPVLAEALPRGGLLRSGTVVAAAMMLVNAAGYVLAVTASRVLAPGAYGELSALLGVLLVAAVPALALQAVVARAVALRPGTEPPGDRERAALASGLRLGLAVAALGLALAPLVAVFLRAGVRGPLWLAAGLAPLVVLAAAQGVLQGGERFGALAALIGVQAAARGVALLPLALGGGAAGVLAALTAGTTAAAVVGVLLARRGAGAGAGTAARPDLRAVAAAAGGLLGLLLLSNLDLLLARHLLSADASGRYAVGAVLTKAALWLPQAVAVVALPRLADPAQGRALLRPALLAVGGLGACGVLGALLLARPAITLAFGATYAPLDNVAPLFVLVGACLAVVQLLVYRGIAVGDVRAARWVLGAAVVEAVALLALPAPSVDRVVTVAACVAVALVGAVLVTTLRRPAG